MSNAPTREEQLAKDAAVAAAGKVLIAGFPVIVVVGAVALLVGCLLLACVVMIVPFQSSTMIWPAPVATAADGGYQANPAVVVAPYGWHKVDDGTLRFHPGIDLAAATPGTCPFGLHCGVQAAVDALPVYIGWDQPWADHPDQAGGGQMVVLANGKEVSPDTPYLAEYETLYKHLEPYRLYVRLEGRIEDSYGRYPDQADYAPIGQGDRFPAGDAVQLVMDCDVMPSFVPKRLDEATILFLYDRPVPHQGCTTTVQWPERGDGWRGWIADSSTMLQWGTQMIHDDRGARAQDVALRYRAHLVPPPPPPTATPTMTSTAELPPISTFVVPQAHDGISQLAHQVLTPTPTSTTSTTPARCATIAAGRTRCVWDLQSLPQAEPQQWTDTHVSVRVLSTQSQLIVQPAAPQWVHPNGGSATWTMTLPANANGLWQVTALGAQTYTYDGRLTMTVSDQAGAPVPCTTINQPAGAHTDCEIPGSTRTLKLSLSVPAGAAGLNETVRLHVNDVDAGGSGFLVGTGTLQIAVGTAPTATPTPLAMATPTPTKNPETAPCYRAAIAALTPQGAIYSQGGENPRDPINPDTGRPYPRTGPMSFDCSGLVWWAYAQAGVTVGWTTYSQVNNGVAINCTMADLRGADTTCWTLGDLIFLDYVGGQHVAIYVGEGLFMDCYNYKADCILHDVTKDSFYWEHFWMARRIVSGCEGLTNDPGVPIEPPEGVPEADKDGCRLGQPSYQFEVNFFEGCGPPIRLNEWVRQGDDRVGFVGRTGEILGPEGGGRAVLQFGMKVRGVDGTWNQTDICTPNPQWMHDLPTPTPGAACWTDTVDPIDFLPRAPALPVVTTTPAPGTTPTAIIPEGAPWQLPPPDYPGSLVSTPEPSSDPVGQYWNPNQHSGLYGGGFIRAFICRYFPIWCW